MQITSLLVPALAAEHVTLFYVPGNGADFYCTKVKTVIYPRTIIFENVDPSESNSGGMRLISLQAPKLDLRAMLPSAEQPHAGIRAFQ